MLRELFMLKAKNKKHNHLFIFFRFDRYRDENDHDTRIKYIRVFFKMVLHQFQKNILHAEIYVLFTILGLMLCGLITKYKYLE